jgi:hypothetical protein
MKGEVCNLRQSLFHSQVHSRKYNLLIYGVEVYETSPAATIEQIRQFAVDQKLEEEYAKRISIRNAHGMQKRDSVPTTIIVVFLYWTEREAFLQPGKRLAGTKMS